MIEKPLVKYFEESFREHWIHPALCNYDTGTIFSYGEVARGVAVVHLLLEQCDVHKGDRVALIGEDSAEWCVVWLGVVTYGAVIVPILPAFTPEDTMHLMQHSDAKVVFVGPEHESILIPKEMKQIRATFRLRTLRPIPDFTAKPYAKLDKDVLMEERYPSGFTRRDVVYDRVDNSDFVLLSYTSGTSGFSKGVMISANNLAANIEMTRRRRIYEYKAGQPMLSFLPLAHAYAMAFDFLSPLAAGAQIYILRYKPTPTILMKALQEVRPQVIFSVPLVLEKIYKSMILKKINASSTVKTIIGIPVLNMLVYKRICKIMIDAMGGHLEQFVVGGAAINDQVERFILNSGFPLTVGYGITECAPLISYAAPKDHKYTSCGKILSDIEEVRVSSIDGGYRSDASGHEVGEIQVKGENVCLGYFKNPEATQGLFTTDGWMRTGDLGFVDAAGYVYLRGRSKAMLLTANGQNIFPEEIESLYGTSPFVSECVVVQRDTKLVAIVVPDMDALAASGRDKDIHKAMSELRDMVNQRLPMYDQVSAVELREEPFEKTPKQSIKRYLVK